MFNLIYYLIIPIPITHILFRDTKGSKRTLLFCRKHMPLQNDVFCLWNKTNIILQKI